MPRRILIAGNWKMNGLQGDGLALAADLAARVKGEQSPGFEMLICPPFVLISKVVETVAGSASSLDFNR